MLPLLLILLLCNQQALPMSIYNVVSDDMVVMELEKAGFLEKYGSAMDPRARDSVNSFIFERNVGSIGTLYDGKGHLEFDRGLIERKFKHGKTVLNYLDDFGYLDASLSQEKDELLYDSRISPFMSRGIETDDYVMIDIPDIQRAVSLFQSMNGLPETGVVDMDVLELMRIPRCGVPDIEPNYFSFISHDDMEIGDSSDYVIQYEKRYAVSDDKWDKKNLTFWIENTSSFMSSSEMESEILRAFKVWTKHIPIDIYQVENKDVADIKIRFVETYHGDKYPFDGPLGILAHAFYPRNGEVHFDDDESFSSFSEDGVNLYYTASHEFGHSLGLKHSLNRDSLMSPYHPGLQDVIQLHEDDVIGITHLYGAGKGTVYDRNDPKSKALESELLTHLEAAKLKAEKMGCLSNIDAVIRDPFNNTLYFFAGEKYYKFGKSDHNGGLTVMDGYPRNITEGWDGLASNISAAFTNITSGHAYFFVDKEYWKYDFKNETMFKGYPRKYHKKLPDDIKAIMSAEDKTYFFTESGVWQHSTGDDDVELVKDVEPMVDAAFPLFVKGYFATTHNSSYSIYKVKNLNAIKVYKGRPLTWDYDGLPMCYKTKEHSDDLESNKLGLLCKAYAMLAYEDQEITIPEDCYLLMSKFPVKPLSPLQM